MKKIALFFALILFAGTTRAQDAPSASEKKGSPAPVSSTPTDNATRIEALETLVRSLAEEVAALRMAS